MATIRNRGEIRGRKMIKTEGEGDTNNIMKIMAKKTSLHSQYLRLKF